MAQSPSALVYSLVYKGPNKFQTFWDASAIEPMKPQYMEQNMFHYFVLPRDPLGVEQHEQGIIA